MSVCTYLHILPCFDNEQSLFSTSLCTVCLWNQPTASGECCHHDSHQSQFRALFQVGQPVGKDALLGQVGITFFCQSSIFKEGHRVLKARSLFSTPAVQTFADAQNCRIHPFLPEPFIFTSGTKETARDPHIFGPQPEPHNHSWHDPDLSWLCHMCPCKKVLLAWRPVKPQQCLHSVPDGIPQ